MVHGVRRLVFPVYSAGAAGARRRGTWLEGIMLLWRGQRVDGSRQHTREIYCCTGLGKPERGTEAEECTRR